MTPQDEIAKYGYQSYADPRSVAELRQANAICDVYCNNCEKLINFVEKPVRRDSLRCQTCGGSFYSITIVDICDPAYVIEKKGKRLGGIYRRLFPLRRRYFRHII